MSSAPETQESFSPRTVSATFTPREEPEPPQPVSTDYTYRDNRDRRRGPRNGTGTVKSQIEELKERVTKQEDTIRRLGAVFSMLSTLQDYGNEVNSLAGSGDETVATGANRTPIGRQFTGRPLNNNIRHNNNYGRGGFNGNYRGRAPGFRG